jgi:ribonuclease P protein component
LERLRKRSEFVQLSKSGQRWVTPAFILQVFKREQEGSVRYGVTASRKVGGAVERNRAKRRLRALIRIVLPEVGLPGLDYVLIAKKEVLKRDFSLMVEELRIALTKVHTKG